MDFLGWIRGTNKAFVNKKELMYSEAYPDITTQNTQANVSCSNGGQLVAISNLVVNNGRIEEYTTTTYTLPTYESPEPTSEIKTTEFTLYQSGRDRFELTRITASKEYVLVKIDVSSAPTQITYTWLSDTNYYDLADCNPLKTGQSFTLGVNGVNTTTYNMNSSYDMTGYLYLTFDGTNLIVEFIAEPWYSLTGTYRCGPISLVCTFSS